MNYTQEALAAAEPEHEAVAREAITGAADADRGWADLQRTFLDVIDEYLARERRRDPQANVDSHEAGGHLRIAFPHLATRDTERLEEHLGEIMAARKKYADDEFFHGYPDDAEVHHEIETFLYFQIPLLYRGTEGSDVALESIVDVAHHVGNWVPDVPDWYDWGASGFRSRYLGTETVRDSPPDDYQEANHFRFVAVAIAASVGTGDSRYLEVATDYADRWCRHVEAVPEGEPVPCSILPDGVAGGEMDHAGSSEETEYEVFYTTVAANTAYDVVTVLQDLYRLTDERRYLQSSRRLLDQFFDHGEGGRPAIRHRGGEWQVDRRTGEFDPSGAFQTGQGKNFVARMALRHDLVAPTPRYEDRILRWADQIDEESVLSDQAAIDTMVAAHYYSGDREWLERGYAMALRTWAALEDTEHYHMCSCQNRQGSKFLMVWLYQPVFAGGDWGTRGQLPVRVLRHRHDGRDRLPPTVGFRAWREGDDELGFEAVNDGDDAVEWSVVPAEAVRFVDEAISSVRLADSDAVVDANRLRLEANDVTTGTITLG